MEKKWKEVEYYGRKYKVSNYGDIISVTSGKTLKYRLNDDGYPTVTLGSNDNRKTKTVHGIVAENFVEKPIDSSTVKYEVNHDDFNRENFRSDNLSWMTHKENILYTVNAGRHAGANRDWSGLNNPNYGNNKLKLKYSENPELAKINCSREGVKNGRCVKVELHHKDRGYINSFDYIGDCCSFLKSEYDIKAKIKSIRTNLSKTTYENVYYRGFYIVRI